MQDKLRKLAASLRKRAKEADVKKVAKCAQVAQAAIGLELLRRKIGR